jgi:hypothetical protein
LRRTGIRKTTRFLKRYSIFSNDKSLLNEQLRLRAASTVWNGGAAVRETRLLYWKMNSCAGNDFAVLQNGFLYGK